MQNEDQIRAKIAEMKSVIAVISTGINDLEALLPKVAEPAPQE